MKKTLAALAVLGAFAGSAAAADVQLYGVVDEGLIYTNTKVTDEKSVDQLQLKSGRNLGSRWGLKGSEDLGNGYKVGFKLESGFEADSGTLQENRLFRREAGLTLYGPFGSLGLGRFGGAVAMQNKVIEETKDFSYFYMDNYYLKTLVEMGYLGLAFFILLLFGLVLWSLRSIGRTGYTKGDRTRVLAVSMFAGMCGVLVHCYFENIFEVPYMMAYFWSMAAAVMYLGYFRKRKT